MNSDLSLLKNAVGIAGKSIHSGGGPFGAVITKDGIIISEANNMVVGSHDPTAHAEVLAIRKAAAFLGTHDLSGCTIYASCEPCPMCLGAIYWSGIRKVFYAGDRKDAAEAGFSDELIYNEIALDPQDRRLEFIRLSDAGNEKVFREWKEYEDKIPY
jgi:guanine deaminase